ncbi:hypothetical protein [Kitasatospora sp. NPDC058218]|uniref:hypothetical protein n=1 Tax=Kitasatospora sp. NPDC058218 TaxID=3346385 RepID=UPI0036DE3608
MLPKTVRGAVEVAAGLVEEVGKLVVGTAAGLLEKSGVDVAEVERRLGESFPPSAKSLQTLAEEAVTAGRAGVDLAVGVARGEVEKAFEKVGDQVTKVGVVLAYLESKLREVEEEGVPAASPQAGPETAAPAPRADGLFGRGWELDDEPAAPAARAGGEPIVAERVEVDEPVEIDPPVPSASRSAEPADRGTTEAAPTKRAAAPKAAGDKPAAKKPAPKEAAAKKAAPDRAATGTPDAKPATAKPATAGKTAARKTAAKKTAVKKTAAATTKRTAAKKAAQAAGQEPPAKRTATRKTTVRKSSSTKKPDA